MAEGLAAITARIHGVRQLDAVIGAMRGIAAAHAQQSRVLLPGVRAYAEAISKDIASALRLHSKFPVVVRPPQRCARVVFCAEHGFVGGFAEYVLDEVVKRSPADLLLIGSRALSVANMRSMSPVWQSPMATQVDGIAPLCLRIASALYQVIATRNITDVEVLFPLWTGGEGLQVLGHSLLPLDPMQFRNMRDGVPPLSTLPPDVLLASLAEEYVYASLCEAAMNAFVAECEARASAMVRAHNKLQEMLAQLHLSEHRIRQDTITAEVIELIGGERANVH
jgi:F-type H+-transporting ATPase subunit gamma